MRRALFAAFGVLLLADAACCQPVAKATPFLAKLANTVGSKASRTGDPVKALVISPERFLGGRLDGTVDQASPGRLSFTFRTLEFKGTRHPIVSRTTDFVNSKGHARVDEDERPVRVADGALIAESGELQLDEGAEVKLDVDPHGSGEEAPFAGVARKTFADLLKIPLADPEAAVTVHKTTEEDGIRIEDVSWESLNGERVPGFVMRKAQTAGRLPAVICLHGSGGSRESESGPTFGIGEYTTSGQSKPHSRLLGWARELARRGYLTIAITQRGLDKRLPRINDQANVMLVEGRTAMGAVLYEIRQAITYLESRPDVDPLRIGTTGLSFGGITAFYTWIVDSRVAAAAPICGGVGSVEVFARTGSIGYHGTYWWVPGMLAKGDQADFAAALAPKPLMIWAPTEDIGMPKEAVDQFVRIVAPAYEKAGNRSALVVHQPPGVHEMTVASFEAMEQFFDRWLRAR